MLLADAPAARPPMLEPLMSDEVLMRKRLGKEPFAGPEPILEMSDESEMLWPTLMPDEGDIVGVAAVRSAGHEALEGGVEEQEPLHWIVPLDCVWPQELPAEAQAEPYPEGLAGGVALQTPFTITPELVAPQAFDAVQGVAGVHETETNPSWPFTAEPALSHP